MLATEDTHYLSPITYLPPTDDGSVDCTVIVDLIETHRIVSLVVQRHHPEPTPKDSVENFNMNHDTSSDLPAVATAEHDANPPRMGSARKIAFWLTVATGLLLIGVGGALLSVKLRRTQIQQTENFFGADAVLALQRSGSFLLRVDPPQASDQPMAEDSAERPPRSAFVELADIPGVGHVRHALLDQRHYDWTEIREQSIEPSLRSEQSQAATIVLSDFGKQDEDSSITFHLELETGWVSLDGQQRSVRFTPRVGRAIQKQLITMSKVRNAERIDSQ